MTGFFKRSVFLTVIAAVLFITTVPAQAVDMKLGPYVQFTDPHTAVVRWETATAEDSIVVYGDSPITLDARVEDATAKTVHEVTLSDVYIKEKYFYRVGYDDSGDQLTDVFWFDNAKNFTGVDVSAASDPYSPDSYTTLYQNAAAHIVAETGITKGICLVYGCGEGRLAFEIAKLTDLTVVGVDDNLTKINTAAEKLMQAGVYGNRVIVRHVSTLGTLPFTKYMANLVVSDRMITDGSCPGDVGEMFRVLRPSGGVAFLGQPSGCPNPLTQTALESWLSAGSLTYTTTSDSNGLWSKVVKPEVTGTGWWTQQYGGAHNNGNSNDTLEGATGKNDFDLQWISWPDSDTQVDRMVRAHSPVANNGRMMHLGFNRVMTLDSYNGTMLWTLEIPQLMRLNIPRDASFICADDDCMYLAVKDNCWRLDGDTGIRSLTHRLNDPGHDWGCVFRYGDKLYGSAVIENAFHTTWWGTSAWFDATSGDQTAQICSKYIFADNLAGSRVWTYDSADADKGVIINSTICLGGGRIYFVESRDPDVESYSSGRVGIADLWNNQYLVALNADTGAIIYQQPISASVADGTVIFYLLYTNETLLLAASDTQYHLYKFNAVDGVEVTTNWPKSFAWASNNHGHHMDRPAVMGDNVYYSTQAYNISTGTSVSAGTNGHCGIVAGTANALLSREGNINMWHKTAGSSNWANIRPNCWLSTIGSGGMILAPDGGGGCDCYGWFHTSVAFVKSGP
ncbi:MAG: class I SAM-dependent methyltransferase [Sedimentisphaerales bacterium]|nr:class I SAM-dependent methyltransferase [Sedimentisphaerales bacterium]